MDSAGVPLLYPKHACVVNWTLTPHPGESLRRDIRLPRVYRDLGIWYPVLSLVATSIFCLGALCSTRYRSRFSRSCLAYFACFSLLGGKKTLFV